MRQRRSRLALLVSFVFQKAQPDRLRGRFGAAREPELVQDVDHVVAGRIRAYEYLAAYLLVRVSVSDQRQDLPFTL